MSDQREGRHVHLFLRQVEAELGQEGERNSTAFQPDSHLAGRINGVPAAVPATRSVSSQRPKRRKAEQRGRESDIKPCKICWKLPEQTAPIEVARKHRNEKDRSHRLAREEASPMRQPQRDRKLEEISFAVNIILLQT